VTVRQAAAKMEVWSSTLWVLVAAGSLKCMRIGHGRGAIRITEAHLAEYLGKAEVKIQ
jgi:excisionase family DNA binding protein